MLFSIFFIGAVLYVFIELVWRGRSHWSMALAGGICLVLLYGIYRALGWVVVPLQLLLFCLIGCAVITAVEFLAGCVFNLWLGLRIWDYSGKKNHLFGQVCLRYTGYWALLCLPAYFLLEFVYIAPHV